MSLQPHTLLINGLPALARRALPLMSSAQRVEAESILAELHTANAAPADTAADYLQRAGRAFAEDLQPVQTALVAALHARSEDALRGLRHLLPGLLRQLNEQPALAAVLSEAMAHSFFTAFHEADGAQQTANALADIGGIHFSEDPAVTEAMRNWRAREVFETDLSSAELRGFSAQLRNRSIFSARTTNATYLKEIGATVDDILAGRVGMAEGRLRLMRKLKVLGYDPAIGFPGEWSVVPPAERGSLQDLSSERRIDLVLETNVRMARGFSQQLAGNSEHARYNYPAWQLVRLYHRAVPRGTPESKSAGWQTRWWDAHTASGGEGALKDDFLALKDSPLWQALGDGAGGYTDTLLNPFPPFAFRSGMAWAPVPRDRAIALGLIKDEALPRATRATLTPGQKEVLRVVNEMPADLRAELERELGL